MKSFARHDSIEAFNAAQEGEEQAICEALRQIIERHLPDAESKIWHAHPVWFLEGNPIVGYSKLKGCIRLLFWSGRSFSAPGLAPEGTFQAAEKRYRALTQVEEQALAGWLAEARVTQWDYKNLIKNRRLVRKS
jgi:hypothetical protein